MNFWDALLTAMAEIVMSNASPFPYHSPIGLTRTVSDFFDVGLGMTTIWLLNLVDLGVPVLMLSIMTIMEFVRALFAIYDWLKELLPTS